MQLNVADVEHLMQMLYFDKSVLKHGDRYLLHPQSPKYKARALNDGNPLGKVDTRFGFETYSGSTPCHGCVHITECSPTGRINPVDCKYMRKWLNLTCEYF